MKKTLTAAIKPIGYSILFLSIFFTGCCDCNKDEPKTVDTTAKQGDNALAFRQTFGAEYKKFDNLRGPRKRIIYPEARDAIRFNREFPCLKAEEKYVNGFLLDSLDLAAIGALKAKELFLQVGVTNFKDSAALRAGTIKPSYTIIVIPLDKDRRQMKDSQGELIAYDFTCPCPTNTACCPQEPDWLKQ